MHTQGKPRGLWVPPWLWTHPLSGGTLGFWVARPNVSSPSMGREKELTSSNPQTAMARDSGQAWTVSLFPALMSDGEWKVSASVTCSLSGHKCQDEHLKTLLSLVTQVNFRIPENLRTMEATARDLTRTTAVRVSDACSTSSYIRH